MSRSTSNNTADLAQGTSALDSVLRKIAIKQLGLVTAAQASWIRTVYIWLSPQEKQSCKAYSGISKDMGSACPAANLDRLLTDFLSAQTHQKFMKAGAR